MIREFESIMSECTLKNENYFPNFIIERKALLNGREVQSIDSENRWKGMLKET